MEKNINRILKNTNSSVSSSNKKTTSTSSVLDPGFPQVDDFNFGPVLESNNSGPVLEIPNSKSTITNYDPQAYRSNNQKKILYPGLPTIQDEGPVLELPKDNNTSSGPVLEIPNSKNTTTNYDPQAYRNYRNNITTVDTTSSTKIKATSDNTTTGKINVYNGSNNNKSETVFVYKEEEGPTLVIPNEDNTSSGPVLEIPSDNNKNISKVNTNPVLEPTTTKTDTTSANKNQTEFVFVPDNMPTIDGPTIDKNDYSNKSTSNNTTKKDITSVKVGVTNETGIGYDKSFNASNGKHYNLYNQSNVSEYSFKTYAGSDWSSDIGWYGCGVTSLTTILSGYGSNKHPGQIVDELSNISTRYALGSVAQLTAQFENYGFNVNYYSNNIWDQNSINSNVQTLRKHLQNGGEAVLVNYYGQTKYKDGTYGFNSASGGHWISALDISADGKYVYISDSAGNDGWSKIEDLFNSNGSKVGEYILVNK